MPPAELAGDPEATDQLGRGRQAYARRAWRDAYESLSQADQVAPLGADDLELLATSAAMLGRDADYLSLLERAHHAYLDGGEPLRAVRCAFWVGRVQRNQRGDRTRNGLARPGAASARPGGAMTASSGDTCCGR